MKLTNFIIGVLIFSIVTTMMFATVQQLIIDNEDVDKDPSEWEELSGDYYKFVGETSIQTNSTLRGMADQTKEGEAGSEDVDVNLITGVIAAGRMSINFFTNFDKVATTVAGDSGAFINPKIMYTVLGIALVFIVLSMIFFIRGFKMET